MYEHREHSLGFAITEPPPAPPTECSWGPYVRRGVKRWRNYGRPIKGGLTADQVFLSRLSVALASAEDAVHSSARDNVFRAFQAPEV